MNPLEKFELGLNHALILAFAMGIAVGFGAGAASPIDLSGEEKQESDSKTFNISGEPVLGDEDANVTMVMFEDFQCPFCRRFEKGEMDIPEEPHDPENLGAYEKIVRDYVNEGEVKIVWKDYPLGSHHWARRSAETMECVYRQDNSAFWQVKDEIFLQQKHLRDSSPGRVQEQIINWSSQRGVSEQSVRSCLENGNPGREVDADMMEGGRLGTPTVYIDGKEISGAQPYISYKSAIESALEE